MDAVDAFNFVPASSHPGWSFQMGSAYQFHSWRVFVLVCAFPSVAAISALTTMPESPRFFLEVGLRALRGKIDSKKMQLCRDFRLF